jgi:hypothetical protein
MFRYSDIEFVRIFDCDSCFVGIGLRHAGSSSQLLGTSSNYYRVYFTQIRFVKILIQVNDRFSRRCELIVDFQLRATAGAPIPKFASICGARNESPPSQDATRSFRYPISANVGYKKVMYLRETKVNECSLRSFVSRAHSCVMLIKINVSARELHLLCKH